MATLRFHGLPRFWDVRLWRILDPDGGPRAELPAFDRRLDDVFYSVCFDVSLAPTLPLHWELYFNDGGTHSYQQGQLDMCGADEVHLEWGGTQNTFVPVNMKALPSKLLLLQVPTGKRCMQL